MPATPQSRFHSLRPALQYLKPYRTQIACALLALVFTASVMLSLGQGLKLLIDQGLATQSATQLDRSILLFMGLIVLLAAGSFTRYFLVSWIGERVVADLRKAVFSHLIHLHPAFFDANRSREIQSRITTDTTLLQTVIGSSVSMALRNAMMAIGGFIWLFVTNWKLASIVIAAVPMVVLPLLLFGRRVRNLSRRNQDRLADVGTYVGETLGNIKTVHAYNHQAQDELQLGDRVELSFQNAVGHIRYRASMIALVILLVMGAVSVMLWVGGHDVMDGKITGGELAAFVFYAVIVGSSLGVLSESWGDLLRAAGAMDRLMELLSAKNEITTPPQPATLPARISGHLHINDLTFAYRSRPDTLAINRLSLDVKPGSRVALVGPSGAGKSTLFDLILRFYDPAAGNISIDGIDIRALAPSAWRAQLGLVPQQPALFTGTLAENIRYGKPDATDAELESAARAAYAWEFIARLPDKLNTQIGEGGLQLSGGQRQRIAIARALLKDPAILLLDEATSALDAESEHMVQQALEGLMKGRTSLVIAHRLSTVIDADCIAVMEQGRLIDIGTHHDLLRRCPLYARLAELQFGLRDDAVELRAEPAEA